MIARDGFGFWFPHSSYLRVQRRETGHLRLRKLRRIHASFEFAGRSQKRRQTDAARNLVECTVVRSFGRGDQELFAICSQCVQRAGPDGKCNTQELAPAMAGPTRLEHLPLWAGSIRCFFGTGPVPGRNHNMKATKSTKSNDKADARQLIVRAVNAEKEAAAARKQARLAKIRYKQARKAFKQAKKAAKQARKEAKIAANTFQAKAEKAKKPQKNRTKSKKHIKVATRKAPATARRLPAPVRRPAPPTAPPVSTATPSPAQA